jgi:hypothetical protein
MAGKRAHQRSSYVTLTPVLSDYKDSRIDLTNETESTLPDTELLLLDLTPTANEAGEHTNGD